MYVLIQPASSIKKTLHINQSNIPIPIPNQPTNPTKHIIQSRSRRKKRKKNKHANVQPRITNKQQQSPLRQYCMRACRQDKIMKKKMNPSFYLCSPYDKKGEKKQKSRREKITREDKYYVCIIWSQQGD
jgi:sulfatase maturation enzyme AslB (radical SAM superfamily)